jgi:hypothetical protein
MSPSRLIAVVGATGVQGSSVVKTFLTLPGWNVRSITRSPTSDKAKELASLGSEVVQADLSDPESLTGAFEGAAAIFVNTDFWEKFHGLVAAGNDNITAGKIAYDAELQNAKNAAIAASKVSTLERYIYSALTPLKAYSNGKYSHAQHFESKAAAVNFIESDLPELAKKTSFIYVTIYNNNLFLFPQRDPKSGKFTVVLPGPKTTQLLIIDASNSVGLYVRALIEDEEPGLKLLAYDTDISAGEATEAWSKVTGEDADFVELSVQKMHETLKIPLEYLDAAGFLAEYSYAAGLDVITPDHLKTKVKVESHQEFLERKGKDALLNNEVVKK